MPKIREKDLLPGLYRKKEWLMTKCNEAAKYDTKVAGRLWGLVNETLAQIKRVTKTALKGVEL